MLSKDTIYFPMCNEAKEQLKTDRVKTESLIPWSPLCVPIWVPYAQRVVSLNTTTQWMSFCLKNSKHSHKSDSEEVLGDCQRQCCVAGKNVNNKQMFNQNGSRSGKIFLGSQWERVGRRLIQKSNERPWLERIPA